MKASDWNKRYAVGQKVVVATDDHSTVFTKTRSPAWDLGGHTPVVMVEGIAGGYALDRVTAVKDD